MPETTYVAVQIWLPEIERLNLKVAALRREQTMSELVREAIRKELETDGRD